MPTLKPPTINCFFSVAQANATLPLVRAIMSDVLRLERKVRQIRFRLKFIGRGEDLAFMFAADIRILEQECVDAETELEGFVDELLQLGVEPEGLALGLVDFPTTHRGQIVYLCWRYGEPCIRFWHTLTGGFVERRPLGELSQLAESSRLGYA